MGYSFLGMFSTGDEAVMADLLQHQRGLRRMTRVHFTGFGVSFEDEYGEELGDFGAGDPDAPSSRLLIDWSRRFPATRNAFVRAECFGGTCDYGGFAFANGEVLLSEPLADATEGEAGAATLRRLLAPLGIQLDESGYFQPFERGFFEWPVPPIAPAQPRVPEAPWWRRFLGGRGAR